MPPCSDEALALAFAARHVDELRYTNVWGRWHYYDGMRWRDDSTRLVYDYARAICREAAASAATERERKDTASAKKRAAVVSLAKEARSLAAISEQWDQSPWSLNTPDGVIDLRTLRVTPHQPAHYLTKMTSVAPRGDCKRWLQFIDEITGGDKALATFLQRVAGYSLTGVTSEHALFFSTARAQTERVSSWALWPECSATTTA